MTLKFKMNMLPDELKNKPLITREDMLQLLNEDVKNGAEAKWASIWRSGGTIFANSHPQNQVTTLKAMLSWMPYCPKKIQFSKKRRMRSNKEVNFL